MSNSDKYPAFNAKNVSRILRQSRNDAEIGCGESGNEVFQEKNVHHLNESIRSKRLERCKQLRTRFAPGREDQILFSDEKLFRVEEASNRQNDRIHVSRSQDIPDSIRYIDRVKKTISLMVWAEVSEKSPKDLTFAPRERK